MLLAQRDYGPRLWEFDGVAVIIVTRPTESQLSDRTGKDKQIVATHMGSSRSMLCSSNLLVRMRLCLRRVFDWVTIDWAIPSPNPRPSSLPLRSTVRSSILHQTRPRVKWHDAEEGPTLRLPDSRMR